MDERMDPFAVPMVFLRVGWMDRYQGMDDGTTIVGGGAYVDERGFGHEIFNFQPFEGRVYGYVQPPRGRKPLWEEARIDLRRLGAPADAHSVPGILCIWVAPSPGGGAVVVGWYRNATVYREWQPPPPHSERRHDGADADCGYYVAARADDAVRLDPQDRDFFLPKRGAGGLGQANILYADRPALHRQLRLDVLRYVESRTPAEHLFGELDEDTSARWWAGLLLRAGDALAGGTIFESPVLRRRYQVQAIAPDRIRIERLDANDPVELTRQRVDLAVRRILEAGGRVRRATEIRTVAKETAFVEFHPAFSWDASRDWIVFRPELAALADEAGTLPDVVEEPSAATSALWSLPLSDLRTRVLGGTRSSSSPRERTRRVHERSQALRVYVLRRANGTCEGCGSPGPFVTPAGHRYLEPHHIQRLADGGPDHPQWVIGLCPNCHRRVHHGADRAEYNAALAKRMEIIEPS
jgi:hypothetical protein